MLTGLYGSYGLSKILVYILCDDISPYILGESEVSTLSVVYNKWFRIRVYRIGTYGKHWTGIHEHLVLYYYFGSHGIRS